MPCEDLSVTSPQLPSHCVCHPKLQNRAEIFLSPPSTCTSSRLPGQPWAHTKSSAQCTLWVFRTKVIWLELKFGKAALFWPYINCHYSVGSAVCYQYSEIWTCCSLTVSCCVVWLRCDWRRNATIQVASWVQAQWISHQHCKILPVKVRRRERSCPLLLLPRLLLSRGQRATCLWDRLQDFNTWDRFLCLSWQSHPKPGLNTPSLQAATETNEIFLQQNLTAPFLWHHV